GIGKTVAHVFARNGIAGLALADVSVPNLEAVQAELREQYPHIRVEIFTVDVTKEEQIAATVQSVADKFGRIDISIHSAGIAGPPTPTHELPLSDWQRVIDVNQTGVMLCDKWVVQQMLKQELRPGYEGRGIIVNLSSMYGIKSPDGALQVVSYTTTKHAVVGLTKFDGRRYADDGIRINAICPGYVDTPFTRAALESGFVDFEVNKGALKRPAKPEEIANAVLFLTSRMGSYMCANALIVDGGSTS
ncbi:hypothetical protein ASPVEDRAFT_142038, partial [Aspergillus versicolor CBS 583.65]